MGMDYDSETPLLGSPRFSDFESLGLLGSPIAGLPHNQRVGVNWRRMRPSLRMVAIGTISVAFFLFGFIVHGPALPRVSVRLHVPSNAPQANAHDAVRVRVLQQLMKERYPAGPWTHSRADNFPALAKLADCLEAGTCDENEKKVVILTSYHFGGAELGGNGGEEVWARSTISALRQLNYTILFCWGHMDTLMIYQHIPDMVPVVLWEPGEFHHCMERNDENYLEMEGYETQSSGAWQTGKKGCLQRADFPEGIPYWKSFMFNFWMHHGHPLGGGWVMAPEDYASFTDFKDRRYLGYSIEEQCTLAPTYHLREHRGMILAKELRYFEEEENSMFGILGAARESVPPVEVHGHLAHFDLVSTAGDEKGAAMPEGIISTGRMPQEEWHQLLARSKMLVGIGHPELSPSPYDALCLGVPFINSVREWDENDPTNREKWQTQQDGLKLFDEPFVYHVFKRNETQLSGALQRAAAHQIDRFIPPRMRMSSVMQRHREWIEEDWLVKAKALVAERYQDQEEYAHLAMEMPPVGRWGYTDPAEHEEL